MNRELNHSNLYFIFSCNFSEKPLFDRANQDIRKLLIMLTV